MADRFITWSDNDKKLPYGALAPWLEREGGEIRPPSLPVNQERPAGISHDDILSAIRQGATTRPEIQTQVGADNTREIANKIAELLRQNQIIQQSGEYQVQPDSGKWIVRQ